MSQRGDLGFADALSDVNLVIDAERPRKNKPTPKTRSNAAAAANALGFVSREAGQGRADKSSKPVKQVRRRRTGRNAQFNLKAKPETIERYCAIADTNQWGLGETLEKAVELLEKQYSAKGKR